MRQIFKVLILFLIGGMSYTLIEMAYRGHTHWTMFLVGGMCFYLIGLVNEIIPWEMPFVFQCLIGAVIVTSIEFLDGCIINIVLDWHVWDYSSLPCNLLGQVCLLFMGLWMLLSAPAILLDDHLRYWLFGEEKPKYTLFWR